MKNKRSLTPFEVIFFFGLIAILILSLGLSIKNRFEQKQKIKYNNYVETIESGTSKYLNKNKALLNSLNNNKGFIIINVGDLIDNKFLDSKLINPENKLAVNKDENIKVSLNEYGNSVITYPYVKDKGSLRILNVMIPISEKTKTACYDNLNTLKLGFIDQDGSLVKDYLKVDENIKCLTDVSQINFNEIGTYEIKYKFLHNNEWEEVMQKIMVVDDIMPTITNINYTPSAWAKSVTITADINDTDSGVASYSISEDCKNFEKTTENAISKKIKSSGLYYLCVKDLSGNMVKKEININNIDATAPVINLNDFDQNTGVLSGSVTDEESGVVAYAISNSTSTPTNWTVIDNTKKFDKITYQITKNGTYYLWAKDAALNIRHSTAIDLNNVKLKTESMK